MKNAAHFILGIMLATGLLACTKKEYIEPGEVENPNTAYIVTLDADNWQRVSNAKIKYDIPLQDLTDYYLLQGGVAVAVSFDGEESYDILPATSEGIAYSVNYGIGWITIFADDPLADDNVTIDFPGADMYAKIILSTTDYIDYQGIFNSPSPEFKFKRIEK